MIATSEQARAIARAQQALTHLEQHPTTTRSQLGAARDQLNITRNYSDSHAVWDAVVALEDLVVTVYGTPPAHQPGQPGQLADSSTDTSSG